MNLRLDSKSVRVRVSLEEARALLAEGSLVETLAFLGRGIEVRIFASPELATFEASSDDRGNVTFRLPAAELRKLLQQAEAFPQTRVDPALESVDVHGTATTRLLFEIDLFSLKKKHREG